MANDSPAKSLVDIDLASLRVSAAEPSPLSLSLLFFFFAAFYFTFLDKTHAGPCGCEVFLTRSPVALVVGAEVLEMTAEPWRGVASVCFSFVRDAFGMSGRPGAQQLAHTGPCC